MKRRGRYCSWRRCFGVSQRRIILTMASTMAPPTTIRVPLIHSPHGIGAWRPPGIQSAMGRKPNVAMKIAAIRAGGSNRRWGEMGGGRERE